MSAAKRTPARGEVIEALRDLHTASYDIVWAANGLIRYVQPVAKNDPAGAIKGYDDKRTKFTAAVDAARDVLRRLDK